MFSASGEILVSRLDGGFFLLYYSMEFSFRYLKSMFPAKVSERVLVKARPVAMVTYGHDK